MLLSVYKHKLFPSYQYPVHERKGGLNHMAFGLTRKRSIYRTGMHYCTSRPKSRVQSVPDAVSGHPNNLNGVNSRYCLVSCWPVLLLACGEQTVFGMYRCFHLKITRAY
jgi:hypothetical protein